MVQTVTSATAPQPQARRFHYAWVIFVVAFITLLGAAGFRSTPGILIDPLGKEFGWSRATVATAVSINVLLFGFIGPFAAALQLRYGLRKITMIALAIISTGALLTTQMTQPWHLYILWGGVVGVGSGCMATVFASTVASRWFVKRRGLVTGALTAASASGQLVFLPLKSYRRTFGLEMGRHCDCAVCSFSDTSGFLISSQLPCRHWVAALRRYRQLRCTNATRKSDPLGVQCVS